MAKIKDKYSNSLVLSHDLIGGKWKLRILWHIMRGENRFSMLRRGIPDISEKVLYANLRELEEAGVLRREIKSYKNMKAIYYFVNDSYEELETIVETIYGFSRKYAKDNNIYLYLE